MLLTKESHVVGRRKVIITKARHCCLRIKERIHNCLWQHGLFSLLILFFLSCVKILIEKCVMGMLRIHLEIG
jgi:hypothetical protein